MKIPNLNTFSTLIDRLCIENVKKAHFVFIQEQNLRKDADIDNKIKQQEAIIEALQLEIVDALEEIFSQGKYEYFGELRTFEKGKK
jgi:hypothetical protein